jgi:hypothetical protein
MNTQKMAGYVLYAIGIIGGVEGATMVRGMTGNLTSVVALVVIVIGAYLLEK